MSSGTRGLLAIPLLILVLVMAGSVPLADSQRARAVDSHIHPAPVVDLNAQLAKAGFAAFKARFHDRAVGFAGIKESQAAANAILEQQRGKLRYWVEKGYITPEQAASASRRSAGNWRRYADCDVC